MERINTCPKPENFDKYGIRYDQGNISRRINGK